MTPAINGAVFRTVRQALGSAFAVDVRDHMRVSRVFADLRADNSRSYSDLSHQDYVAQAGLTLRLARQVLSPVDWNTIVAYYTPAHGRELRQKKAEALLWVLSATLDRAAGPRRFKAASAMVWSGFELKTRLTREQWAKRYGCAAVTVDRWTRGGTHEGRKPGIVRLLEAQLIAAEGALIHPFTDAGVI